VSERNTARSAFTILMNLLVLGAAAVTVRLIVMFFGQISAREWSEAIVALTNPITLPVGLEGIKTPYGGVFDLEAAVTIIVLLAGEWVLSIFRSRA